MNGLCEQPSAGKVAQLAAARYPTLLDSQTVQSQLRADEIAVVYFLAEPNSFRWVMSRTTTSHWVGE